MAFWMEKTPFIDQKCTYCHCEVRAGASLPPFLGNTRKKTLFPQEMFPKTTDCTLCSVQPNIWGKMN